MIQIAAEAVPITNKKYVRSPLGGRMVINMKNIYENNPMNAPRIGKDKLFVDERNEYSYSGFIDTAYRFIEDFQLLDREITLFLPKMTTNFLRIF